MICAFLIDLIYIFVIDLISAFVIDLICVFVKYLRSVFVLVFFLCISLSILPANVFELTYQESILLLLQGRGYKLIQVFSHRTLSNEQVVGSFVFDIKKTNEAYTINSAHQEIRW